MSSTFEGMGARIRNLRKEKGLTLSQMSSLCECSSGLLSQIETGTVNPSLSTLKAIREALGVPLAQMIQETPPSPLPERAFSYSMKPKERKVLITEGKVQFQLLSRNLHVPFEFILNQWPPGSSTGKELYTHEGTECGLLLEGELQVEVNGVVHRMKPGDTITLRSSSPHRVSNPGKKKAVAVWVNSVPWVFSTR